MDTDTISEDVDARTTGFALIAIVINIALFFYVPLIVTHGWQWFAQPLGAPDLDYWAAFGLVILSRVFLSTSIGSQTPDSLARRKPAVSAIAYLGYFAFQHWVMWVIAT